MKRLIECMKGLAMLVVLTASIVPILGYFFLSPKNTKTP